MHPRKTFLLLLLPCGLATFTQGARALEGSLKCTVSQGIAKEDSEEGGLLSVEILKPIGQCHACYQWQCTAIIFSCRCSGH